MALFRILKPSLKLSALSVDKLSAGSGVRDILSLKAAHLTRMEGDMQMRWIKFVNFQ